MGKPKDHRLCPPGVGLSRPGRVLPALTKVNIQYHTQPMESEAPRAQGR
uniref:Uncharacterized protein n=1 Tax=Anguilla anguilla TaxID=7936 RepID=A0A0E9T8E6_ANGAN